MSQKIIIPKGTIDSAHTTIIEIPNYLHETSTVVVTMPKTADSAIEQSWEANEYDEGAEQNENDWEQNYDGQEANDDEEYTSDQQDQYDAGSEDPDSGNEAQQQGADQDDSYPDYAEEPPAQPTRRPKFDPYSEQMRRRVLDKKREVAKMRAERQRMLEGESGTYETTPRETDNVEDDPALLSEVPEDMRGRSAMREKEKKRRMQEFERNQPYSAQTHPVSQTRYHRAQGSKYPPPMKSQQYVATPYPTYKQCSANAQAYPNVQFVRQGQPRTQTPAGPQRRQMTGQVEFPREEARQYQKQRRKPVFNIPRN